MAADTLAALRDARRRGVRVLVVTGRILDELRRIFRNVDGEVDAVGAENGAVVSTAFGGRRLSPPIDPAGGVALTARGIAWRGGEVPLACSGHDEETVLEVGRGLGLDCRLVPEPDRTMVLPAGITKGTTHDLPPGS